jgi:putative transposase
LSHHIHHRGNNRCDVFRDDDDRRTFLGMLYAVAVAHHVAVHGYSLLTTHYHAQMTAPAETSLPRMMQCLGRRYVRYFNHRHRRTGTLWEGRYCASLIDSERYWFVCLRYVEMNAVSAHMVAHPGTYEWSSYHANALGAADPIITTHPLYEGLGATPSERRARWAEWCGQPTSERDLAKIRAALRRGERLGPE